ncbi:Ppx/GppA family phosphatase [Sphingomonas sp.]|uniref:Ppx/GppA family phosphatase n=1 Tax=Sphingomonas sp. TaxID=28214 RepID=UPI001E183A5B|nr:Ppx/GppA family phosphatase [Sphingomonas sp.]MBX9796747.1 Ppx/GppA family phosphatase [Sphingomonas sp.]
MATLFFRKPRAQQADDARLGVIDIGSNSIRLVVYQGPARLPAILFNEKVMAGLGRSFAATGEIDAGAMAVARDALRRFTAVAREMEVTQLRTVATAAVRDAANGAELLAAAAALGLEVELLSGEQEAVAAGLGVISAIPDADGIVGDLGGGSLELVRVKAGAVHERASFPLGVLRLPALRADSGRKFARRVGKLLAEAGWEGRGADLPFYLVGGSWRALARLDMHQSGYALPIIHHYRLSPEAITRLGRTLSHISKSSLRAIPSLSAARLPTLGDAAALLGVLVRELGARETIVSSFGLREGLLYGALNAEQRAQDPLIAAARDEGRRLGRFPEHGDVLDDWIAPLFAGEDAAHTRLRHAACLLADVGWRANPEFRAERGMEIALHGNWVAIDAAGRALLAQAVFTSLGGGLVSPDPLAALAPPAELRHAMAWGLAMRLGQRLSGGLAGPLERSTLTRDGDAVVLTLKPGDIALYSEAVERRHRALATLLGATMVLRH